MPVVSSAVMPVVRFVLYNVVLPLLIERAWTWLVRRVSMWIGILLVIFGVLMLLQHMGIIRGSIWGFFWPAIIIAVGLAMILNRNRPFRGRS